MPEDQKSRVDIPASLAVCEKATPGDGVIIVRDDDSTCVSLGNPRTGPHCQGDWNLMLRDARLFIGARDPETGWSAALKELEAARAELKRRDTPVAVENERYEGFRGLCACGLDTEGPKFCGNCGCPLDWSKA